LKTTIRTAETHKQVHKAISNHSNKQGHIGIMWFTSS